MKKIIPIFSVIIVFIVTPIIVFYHFGSTDYLNNFLNNQMIPLMGTIMALNFAIATSLQAILLNIEATKNKELFPSTRHEINDNLKFMILVFALVFILQCINVPDKKILLYIMMGFKLMLFFVYFYAIYDLNSALFKISSKK